MGFAPPVMGLGLGAGGAAPPLQPTSTEQTQQLLIWPWLCSAICPAARQGQEVLWQPGDPSCPPAAARGSSPAAAAGSASRIYLLEICDENAVSPFSACWEFDVGVLISVCSLFLQSGTAVPWLCWCRAEGAPVLLLCIRGRSREPRCPTSPAQLLGGCARWAQHVPHVLGCDVAAASGKAKPPRDQMLLLGLCFISLSYPGEAAPHVGLKR